MGIDDPGLGKIVLVLGFISLLLVGLFYARRQGKGLISKFNNNKFIKLEESISLSTQDRASIIVADKSRFLIVHGKGHQPSITKLPKKSNAEQKEIFSENFIKDSFVKESS